MFQADESDVSYLPREGSPSDATGKDIQKSSSPSPSAEMTTLTNGENSAEKEDENRQADSSPTQKETHNVQSEILKDTNSSVEDSQETDSAGISKENGLTNGTEPVAPNSKEEGSAQNDKEVEIKGSSPEQVEDSSQQERQEPLAPMVEMEEQQRDSPRIVQMTPEPVSKVEDNSEIVEATELEIGPEEREETPKEPESDTQDSYTPIQTPSDKSSHTDKPEDDDKGAETGDETPHEEETNEEQEAETYLINQEAEKQVMHELIDETVVLEKDINTLETKLAKAEAEKSDFESQVTTLKQERELLTSRISQLEAELKEAKMGDGEQRRLLEESQQRVVDLEDQLKRMARDDEEKSNKLSKAEKELLDLTDKCRRLEIERENQSEDAKQQSKTCAVM